MTDYRSNLKEGESLWWINDDVAPEDNDNNTITLPAKIRLYKTLDPEEKETFKTRGMALFPELFSRSTTKFDRLALWLISDYGIVNSSTRDMYSAGGRETVIVGGNTYEKIPKIFSNIQEWSLRLKDEILSAKEELLYSKWMQVPKIGEERYTQWINLVCRYAGEQNFNLYQYLADILL